MIVGNEFSGYETGLGTAVNAANPGRGDMIGSDGRVARESGLLLAGLFSRQIF